MEIFEEVKIYEIHMKCDKCKDGYMKFLNSVKSSSIDEHLKYLHRCNKCGHEEYYENIYPRRTSKCIPIEDEKEMR